MSLSITLVGHSRLSLFQTTVQAIIDTKEVNTIRRLQEAYEVSEMTMVMQKLN